MWENLSQRLGDSDIVIIADMDKVIRGEVLKQIVSGESSCRFISTHWYGSTRSIYLMKDFGATDWEKDTGGRVFFYSVSQTQAIGMAFTKYGRISKLWSTANLTWSCLTKRNSSWTSLKWNHNVHPPPPPPINALRMSHVWIPNLVLHPHTHHSTRCGCGATVVNRKCLQCQAYHNFVVKKNYYFCSSPNTNTNNKNMNICDVFEFVVLRNCKIYEYIRNPIPPK